ncbi:MAG: hypothetical protein GXP49_10885 [Deltaproteobacteria bacterium]|nr:hypothetical protein [Deltaproteobacteria bacterium]
MRSFLSYTALGMAIMSLAYSPCTSAQNDPGHGKVKIDWANKVIIARGTAAPNLKAANVAAARLGAERAAKIDAWRNIIEALKGVKVDSGSSVGDKMKDRKIKTRVEGIVKNFEVLDTKYFSDGGVDVIVRMRLDGPLTKALLPPKSGAKKKIASKMHTGLIVDARGLKIAPALAPRILDEKGNEVYGPSVVTPEGIEANGIAGYARDLDQAENNPRVSGNPLIIKAKAAKKPGGCDIILSSKDVKKLKARKQDLSFLGYGRVMIVTDAE